ncbi:hypothetical protein [Streptomyces sp. NPDC053560]|uniref:hypothetical protein n=1 Tax=Streptomyces sp. NPDC053560 TaxID=3365711 RepID=UPI0037D14DDF
MTGTDEAYAGSHEGESGTQRTAGGTREAAGAKSGAPEAKEANSCARVGVLGTGPFVPRTRWWHWRRLTRGRLRPALAAAVAGALLGGTAVAWQAEAGPFAGGGRSCWGALGSSDVAGLLGGSTDIDSVDTPIEGSPIGGDGPSGQCVLHAADGDRVTVQIHRLDNRFGGSGDQWADEFLSARLSPLGGGMLGMASDTRAWLAVPDGCVGRSGTGNGPVVVDVTTGPTLYDDAVETDDRARLARTVVKLVNHYTADRGCEGTLADPVSRLPRPGEPLAEKSDAVCGIEGLRAPGKGWFSAYRPRVTRGTGPVRTCDRNVSFHHPDLRLMTIEDPRLAVIYDRQAYDGGQRIKAAESDGHGILRPDLALFQASCPIGDVTFLMRADDADRAALIRALFPQYAAEEADRLGCGPLRISLPAGE